MKTIIPDIFRGYAILSGMTIRGDAQAFPPHGYSFRKMDIDEDAFSLHQKAIQQEIGLAKGKRIISLNLVHGTDILKASEPLINDGDGLHTNEAIWTLAIPLADCCGIMIYDRRNHAIMALHSGWRGTAGGIGTKGIEIMVELYGSKREDLLIWLTPCAGADSYFVGEEFCDLFPLHTHKNEQGLFLFDLRACILNSLLMAGIRRDFIELSRDCTIMDNRFHSYRRDGNLGRNVAFMSLL